MALCVFYFIYKSTLLLLLYCLRFFRPLMTYHFANTLKLKILSVYKQSVNINKSLLSNLAKQLKCVALPCIWIISLLSPSSQAGQRVPTVPLPFVEMPWLYHEECVNENRIAIQSLVQFLGKRYTKRDIYIIRQILLSVTNSKHPTKIRFLIWKL